MNIALTYENIHDLRGCVEKVSFRARFASYFKSISLKRWMAKRAKAQIRKMYAVLYEAYGLIQKDKSTLEGISTREYNECSEFVVRLTRLNDMYEKADFFEDKSLEKLMSDTLLISYYIEAEFKHHVLKDHPIVKTDQAFKEGLSERSKNALWNKL